MAKPEPIFTRATFQFFRDLARNNRKVWMDANRERYQEFVVKPFRRLLEEVSPAVLQLDSRFETTGRAGANFSRINRDIRFAKDKTPYRAQMYLKFSAPFPGEGETGQLYVGISADTVTVGFRIYAGSKRKESALAVIGDARVLAQPKWIAQQKKRLSKRYESLLVWRGERRVDGTKRLARWTRRLEETAGVDRSPQAKIRRRHAGHFSDETLQKYFASFIRCYSSHR